MNRPTPQLSATETPPPVVWNLASTIALARFGSGSPVPLLAPLSFSGSRQTLADDVLTKRQRANQTKAALSGYVTIAKGTRTALGCCWITSWQKRIETNDVYFSKRMHVLSVGSGSDEALLQDFCGEMLKVDLYR
jgi:hypothetical protein